jgi:NADPH2:quinone reductase
MSGAKMRAVVVGENGVETAEVDVPEIDASQVLVKVAACSVNRSDLLTVQGHNYGHVGGAQKIMGASFTGEVVAVSDDAEGIAVGDMVTATGAAGWAEYAVSHWQRTLPVPASGVELLEVAGLTSGLCIMHDAIVTNGHFEPGQTMLVQGASSGVGIIAMQIGKHLGASLVIGTSTNAERRGRLSEVGADMALDSRDEGWVDQVLEATDGKGVDLTIDQVSGNTANQNMSATKVHGRIINIGRLGGEVAEFDFNKHAERRLTYIGTTGRTRSLAEHIEVVRLARESLWDALANGAFRMPIDSTYSLDEADAALDRMAANAHFGRIMLTVGN